MGSFIKLKLIDQSSGKRCFNDIIFSFTLYILKLYRDVLKGARSPWALPRSRKDDSTQLCQLVMFLYFDKEIKRNITNNPSKYQTNFKKITGFTATITQIHEE